MSHSKYVPKHSGFHTFLRDVPRWHHEVNSHETEPILKPKEETKMVKSQQWDCEGALLYKGEHPMACELSLTVPHVWQTFLNSHDVTEPGLSTRILLNMVL